MRAGLVFLSCLQIFTAAMAAQTSERITEIRVHGNHTIPDADILALSSLALGEDPSEGRLRDSERKIRATGRFEGVELRRRYLSIADPSQILVMIIVDEHPAVSTSDPTPGRMKKIASAGMWLPILHWEDGHGLTYGARYSFNDPLGERSRLSIPVSWGGERRIAVEAERLFGGPITLVRGGISLSRRVNPHFHLPDTRREARVEAERVITNWLRVGTGVRTANVQFGAAYNARHTGGGGHVVIDTRLDPSFPRNAVYVRLEWERLAFQARRANLWRADVRGYLGVVGATVLAVRGQVATSTIVLPLAEQRLLGGSASLRGYPTGHRSGDNVAAGTIEIRQPLSSPLSIGRLGVKAFVDAGIAWSAGGRTGDQQFERGIGGGVYVGGGPFVLDLDVAWPEKPKPGLISASESRSNDP